jgi:hypothetical protein
VATGEEEKRGEFSLFVLYPLVNQVNNANFYKVS